MKLKDFFFGNSENSDVELIEEQTTDLQELVIDVVKSVPVESWEPFASFFGGVFFYHKNKHGILRLYDDYAVFDTEDFKYDGVIASDDNINLLYDKLLDNLENTRSKMMNVSLMEFQNEILNPTLKKKENACNEIVPKKLKKKKL